MNSRKITLSFTISRPTLSLVLLTLLSCVLLLAGVIRTQQLRGVYLLWNLFLAWMPLFFALVARRFSFSSLEITKTRKLLLYGCLSLWLLFFPNSPYIITDLIHLTDYESPILWFDAVSFFIVAFAGLVTGLYSLYVAHQVLNRLTTKLLSWIIVLVSIVLSGFGLYLGRFVRFNSWDLFTNPLYLFRKSFQELQNPLAMQTTMVFSLVVMVLYISLTILIPSSYETSKNVAKL